MFSYKHIIISVVCGYFILSCNDDGPDRNLEYPDYLTAGKSDGEGIRHVLYDTSIPQGVCCGGYSGGFLDLDIDADGENEYKISIYGTSTIVSNSYEISISSIDGASYIATTTAPDTLDGLWGDAFDFGDTIQSQMWRTGDVTLKKSIDSEFFNTFQVYGSWNNSKYIGLKFENNSGIDIYGWLKISEGLYQDMDIVEFAHTVGY